MPQSLSRDILLAARRLAERNELGAASMAAIAAEAGLTRVTLYRRGATREVILAALHEELAREEQERFLPILTAAGNARERMTHALEALCELTESRMDLLVGLDEATLSAIYHDHGEPSLTHPSFAGPFSRLLRDGALDGSLREVVDPDETATVLYAQISYTYLHLRREHHWAVERAATAVVDVAMHGLDR